jgi:hypothetical protein
MRKKKDSVKMWVEIAVYKKKLQKKLQISAMLWLSDAFVLGWGFIGMAAGGVHHLAQCITCHAWNADMSST